MSKFENGAKLISERNFQILKLTHFQILKLIYVQQKLLYTIKIVPETL